MGKTIIKNGTIVNDGEQFVGSIVIDGECIESIIRGELPEAEACTAQRIVDATGKWVLPGAIDDQVHFREPGLTHKAEIATESVAAAGNGILSRNRIWQTPKRKISRICGCSRETGPGQ